MQKYAFLDRDGTLIWEPEKPEGVDLRETYPLKNATQVSFIPGAIDGLKQLKERGYRFVLVTNQTFLGTVGHPREVFDQVMERMTDELRLHDLGFAFVMICPHGPDEGCNCRKPAIGGLDDFLKNNQVDFKHSLMFGDRATDEEFAKNLGVRFVLIKTNQEFRVPEYA